MGSTAIASSAIMISASAARDAKEAKCAALIDGYEHATATIEQRQDYADCIDVLHPGEITGHEIIGLKIIIVCAFAGALIGVWKGRDSSWGVLDSAFHALFGAAIGTLAPVLVAVIAWAIHFLFTA